MKSGKVIVFLLMLLLHASLIVNYLLCAPEPMAY